ncbi:hypothetical protein AXW83_16425 [Bosea sp. PAMC 26642]|nr:hypothetical protein AXW83_16425 [Bosea sp. PAMC 26642]
MASDLLIVGAPQTDGAQPAFSSGKRQAIGGAIDQAPGAVADLAVTETDILLKRQNLQVFCSAKRNTVFDDVCSILIGIKLDIHGTM